MTRLAEAMAESPVRRAGAIGFDDGFVEWRVWAPAARQVTLVLLDGEQRVEIPMARGLRGYHRVVQQGVELGQRYRYRLDGGRELADPCSVWQPEGAFGPSAVVFPDRFRWNDASWKGVCPADLVFYEIHVGTFTPEGTFEAIIPRLGDLAELGITAIEIMPVGQFPGGRSWGYDGVFPYAVQNTYGGPLGLQSLVDACHANGLAIFLDVVYNHFGPEANILGEFGPYQTDRYKTPWGAAVNFDQAGCDAVRDFVLDNVRMWLEEFHLDGLRLDAADTLFDLGARHILREIKETASVTGQRRGWPATVVAESDLDDPRLLYPQERGGHALDLQWMDDYHHAVHACLTGERHGYYADFGDVRQLTRVLQQPYLYHWEYSAFRDRRHGAPPEGLSGDRFVVFLQNHDHVGNRAGGERLGTLLQSPAKVRLAASLLLLSPYIPLLFMGEEYGEENPFPFFCSFQDSALNDLVRKGREQQFGDLATRGQVPDPSAETTFASAALAWSWPEGTPRAGLRRLHQDLLAARRFWPALRDFENRTASLSSGPAGAVTLELVRGGDQTGQVRALFNLGEQSVPISQFNGCGLQILFSSESPRYGGSRREWEGDAALMGFECVVVGPPSLKPLDSRLTISL